MTRLDLMRVAPLVVIGVAITAADLAFYRGRNPLELGYTLAERMLIAGRALWLVVYWRNRSTSSGGILDLDSNANCTIDGVRNENITWPEGSAPSGVYTVRVNYYKSCGVAATNYIVSVNNGGHVSRFSGRFTGSGELSGPGAFVTTFAVP